MPLLVTLAMLQGPDISMGLQVKHHTDIVSQITKKLGSEKVQQHLNKCLYYVNIGSNDYLNNYFLPQFYPTNAKYNADQYAAALVKEHSTYLKVFTCCIFSINPISEML
jgi:hypothetical protein